MSGQGELFDGEAYYERPVESFGEYPPLTREEFVAFCDSLHDYGEVDLALHLFELHQDKDEVAVEDIIGSFGYEA